MAQTHLEAPRVEGTAVIRNEPVQARSAARLTALLDAAAHVVHEIGYERLTTAMVADRAGASIGTVYRFFPDRIAAYREAKRVLVPGGHFLFNVWDRIEENVFADEVTNALAEIFPDDPPRFMARTPHGYHDKALIRR